MRSRYAASDLAIPFRPFFQRALLAALVTFCIILLFSARSENGFAQTVRVALLDVMVPVIDVLSKPVEAVNEVAAKVSNFFDVYAENQRLKIENQRLMEWQTVALKLEAENQGLRELMHYNPRDNKAFVTAKVIGHTSNSISQRLIIDSGKSQGVQVHQAVMTDQGLVGRVMAVGDSSAEILMLTDMNSRVPVVTEPTGIRSILAGNRSDMPQLTFVSSRKSPQLGDVVVTSAEGELFPAGLPVGKLFAESNGDWQVRPFVDLSSVRYVHIVILESHAASAESAVGTSSDAAQ